MSLSKKWPLRHDDGSCPSFPSYFGGFRCASLVSTEEEEGRRGPGEEEATLYDVWSREAFLWDPIMPPLPRRAPGFSSMLLRSPILPFLYSRSKMEDILGVSTGTCHKCDSVCTKERSTDSIFLMSDFASFLRCNGKLSPFPRFIPRPILLSPSPPPLSKNTDIICGARSTMFLLESVGFCSVKGRADSGLDHVLRIATLGIEPPTPKSC